MAKTQERIAVFVFGIVFLVAMLVLAINFPEPTTFQYEVFKVVLALAAAGVAAMVPGFLEVTVPGWAKAGGAIAVFVLIMYKSPASLVVPKPSPMATLNVQVDPDTVGIAPGKHQAVTYRFREVNGIPVTVDSQDVRWLLRDGRVLDASIGNRILGGSFTVAGKSQHELLDNVYMPPAIASKLQEIGASQVQLETMFTANDSGDKKVKAKAILTIGVLR